MHYSQRNFRDSEYFCKLGKEYLNTLLCKFNSFSRQNLQTFDISHTFLPLTIAKLSRFKNGPVLVFSLCECHKISVCWMMKKTISLGWLMLLT